MKVTWLHIEFVLIFITSPSQGKLGRTAAKHLLTLASLSQSMFRICVCHLASIKICKKTNKQKHICSVRQAAWHRQSWQLEFQSLPDRHITTVKCTPGLLCLCSAASLPALLLCPSAALTALHSSLSASPAGRLPPSAA